MVYTISSAKEKLKDDVYCYSQLGYGNGDRYFICDHNRNDYTGIKSIFWIISLLFILVVPYLNIITSVLLFIDCLKTKFIHEYMIKSTYNHDTNEEVLKPVYIRSIKDSDYPKTAMIFLCVILFVISCIVTQNIDIKNFF